MDRIIIYSLALVWMTACATKAQSPEDLVVGTWKGSGRYASLQASFKSDHSFRLYNTELQQPVENGKWTYANGKFRVPGEKGEHCTAWFNDKGQLCLIADSRPQQEFILDKGGPPSSKNELPDPKVAENLLIGTWEGSARSAVIRATFKNDHTFQIYDTGDREVVAKGKWSYADGKFAMPGEEARDCMAWFNDKGQLCLIPNGEPEKEIVFDKAAAPPIKTDLPKTEFTEESVLGTWKGSGEHVQVEASFKSDHQFQLYDAEEGEVIAKGKWSYADGKFMMPGEEGEDCTAWFNEKGQLCLIANSEPEEEIVLNKPAAQAPKTDLPKTKTTEESAFGTWKGSGMFRGFEATINQDRTFRLYDSQFKEVMEEGKWTYADGKWALPGKEGNRSARINEKGKLSITVDEMPEVEMILNRAGDKPPVTASPGKPPVGEWRYAYTSKSSIQPSGPPFDIMTFADNGKVNLKNTILRKSFDHTYKVSGDVISIETGEKSIPELNFRFGWMDNEQNLVLGLPATLGDPTEVEFTFLKPEKFITSDLEGTWLSTNDAGGFTQESQFVKDGSYLWLAKSPEGRLLLPVSEKHHNFYRIWNSPYGPAVTTVILVPDMGVSMAMMNKFEKTDSGLVMTPIEATEEGKLELHEDLQETWKLK